MLRDPEFSFRTPTPRSRPARVRVHPWLTLPLAVAFSWSGCSRPSENTPATTAAEALHQTAAQPPAGPMERGQAGQDSAQPGDNSGPTGSDNAPAGAGNAESTTAHAGTEAGQRGDLEASGEVIAPTPDSTEGTDPEDSALSSSQDSGAGSQGQDPCPLFVPVPPSAVPGGVADDLLAYQVTGEGACRPTPRARRIILSVPAREPRRLGSQVLTVVHPGDYLLMPRTGTDPLTWVNAPRGSDALARAQAQHFDAQLKPLRGQVPPGTTPLKELEKVTNGALATLGTFNLIDDRAADGPASVQVMFRAGTPRVISFAVVSFAMVQQVTRSGRGVEPTPQLEERKFSVKVVPATSPIVVRFGSLEDSSQPIVMGARDLWTLSISLGYMNRGGSEERGPVGVKLLASP